MLPDFIMMKSRSNPEANDLGRFFVIP